MGQHRIFAGSCQSQLWRTVNDWTARGRKWLDSPEVPIISLLGYNIKTPEKPNSRGQFALCELNPNCQDHFYIPVKEKQQDFTESITIMILVIRNPRGKSNPSTRKSLNLKSSPDCLLFCQLLNKYSQCVAILSNFLDMSIVILLSWFQTHLGREQGKL